VGRFVSATVKALLLLAATPGAWGQTSPFEYCQQIRTDDTLRTVPPSLVSAVARLLQLEAMPLAQVERSTYFRAPTARFLPAPSAQTWLAARLTRGVIFQASGLGAQSIPDRRTSRHM
jgi:hypothetical protein